jgi:hypothetical protein
MGVKVVEVHVNTVLAADRAQAQPLGLVAEVVKLSPVGRVTTSVGSLWAGRADPATEGTMIRA